MAWRGGQSAQIFSGRDWHEQRSLELAANLRDNAPADFVVKTDNRSPRDIAVEISSRMD